MTSLSSKAQAPPTRQQPTLRDEQRDLTRRRLLAAAKIVFERTGYGQATIGDITAEASINRKTFYLHFSNKAELFNSVLDELKVETAKYWRLLDEALASRSQSAVREWFAAAFKWWDDNAAIQPAVQEAAASDLDIAAGWKGRFDLMSLELERYLELVSAEEREDARTRVQFLVVQLDQICFRWRVQHVLDVDLDHVIDLLTDMWCSVLRIDAP